jgi:pimeloyl-ACP methyl ester carboxylesterase
MSDSAPSCAQSPAPTDVSRNPIAPLSGRFIDVDGVRMYHRVCERAGPAAPAVVHVHGFGISGSYLEPTAVLMSQRARHYIPDLPGTGRSARSAHAPDIQSSMHDLLDYCDAIGLERATFVGNSLGCVTLLELADSHPDRVEGLVFVSPAGGPNNQPLAKALGQMTVDGTREPFSLAKIAVRDYLRFGLLRSLARFRAMTRYPTLDRLALLDRPVLVVVGHHDPLVDIDRIRQLFGGRRAMSAVLVEGAHALNFTHPVTVAALISAHLDGTPLGDITQSPDSIQILFESR